MAFVPLPNQLLDILHRQPDLTVLELGCGDGRFSRILAGEGADVWGLDLVPPARGTVARVVGDARRPPLRPGHWPVVVAANLVRHLAPDRGVAALVRGWLDLVATGGSLWILEDAPGGTSPAEANFAALQALLAELPGRGPLLGLAGFLADMKARSDGIAVTVTAAAEEENRYPLESLAVLAMLESGRPAPGTPADHLAQAIAADGVTCGRYWWVRMEHGK